MVNTVETLAVRVSELEKARDRNNEDHGRMFDRIEKAETVSALLQENVGCIRKLCKEIQLDVKVLKDRPAKRYENLVNTVSQWLVLAILAAVVVFK